MEPTPSLHPNEVVLIKSNGEIDRDLISILLTTWKSPRHSDALFEQIGRQFYLKGKPNPDYIDIGLLK